MIPLKKLIEVPRPQLSPDEFGFLIALDKDLRSRQHSGPGGIPYETARDMIREIGAIPAMGMPPGISGDEYFKQLADIFQKYNIEPFAGHSVAFVGFYDPLNKPTLARVDARLKPKVSFDIAPQTGNLLTTANALQLTDQQKVDYVVTGNVVNAPNHELLRAGLGKQNDNPWQVMRGAALMLKQGGYAIHLCGHGGDMDAMAPLTDKTFIASLGQEWEHTYAERSDFEAVVLHQATELAAAPDPAITDSRFISTGQMTDTPKKGESKA